MESGQNENVSLENEMESGYNMLQMAMKQDGEVFDKRTCTLDETSLRKEFDVGYGSTKGEPFAAWGERWVYFLLCYDGL